MTHEPLHHVDLYPDGFSRGPNVFQQVIDCMSRTHETLHPGKLFSDQYEITLARPIHTHNKDPDLTNLPENGHPWWCLQWDGGWQWSIRRWKLQLPALPTFPSSCPCSLHTPLSSGRSCEPPYCQWSGGQIIGSLRYVPLPPSVCICPSLEWTGENTYRVLGLPRCCTLKDTCPKWLVGTYMCVYWRLNYGSLSCCVRGYHSCRHTFPYLGDLIDFVLFVSYRYPEP